MNDRKENRFSPSFITALLVISIALTGFLTYRDMLNYFFTSPDAFHFIISNKVKSFNDIIRILKEPLLPDALAFYRPVLRLSYSLDYFLWGLNPFGYHLTALLLHTAVAISVFFFMLSLNCSRITAWLSAIIFCIHPITVASVPEITRSHDVLSVFFILLSIIFIIKHLSCAHCRKIHFILSIFFYILALGSKEIAVISPAVIFAYLMIMHFSNEDNLMKRLALSLKKCIPYFALTIFFVILRARIIEGVIRYPTLFGKSLSTFQVIKSQIKISADYFIDLVYPVNYLYFLPDVLKNIIIFIIALFVLLIFLPVLRRAIMGIINYKNRAKNFPTDSGEGRQLFFLLIFLLLPLAVYAITVTFDHRYMYLPLIPFSAILSLITVEGSMSVFKQINEQDISGSYSLRSLISYRIVPSLLAAGLFLTLFAYSPLVRSYREYEYNGNILKNMFVRVTDILSSMPDDTVINIYNMPGSIIYHGDFPPDKKIQCMDPPTLKIWLDLNYPDNKYKVVVHNTVVHEVYKKYLNSIIKLEIKTDNVNGVADLIFPAS